MWLLGYPFVCSGIVDEMPPVSFSSLFYQTYDRPSVPLSTRLLIHDECVDVLCCPVSDVASLFRRAWLAQSVVFYTPRWPVSVTFAITRMP